MMRPGRSVRQAGAVQRQRQVHLRQAVARGRRRQRRRRVPYQPWRHLTRDQQAVATRLAAGDVTQVSVSGWGYLARFLDFLRALQYAALLDLPGAGFQRVLIPIAQVVLTYHLKIVLGIGSINQTPARLFRDTALLRFIGYSAAQIEHGFCRRGGDRRREGGPVRQVVGPMHTNTLADAIERLTPTELETVLNGVAQRLAVAGCLRTSTGHFALDASDLPATRRYQGVGRKRKRERVGVGTAAVLVDVLVYGFKVLIVYDVHLRLVVAAKVVPINVHESDFTVALVRQAVANLGPGVLRVLLLDSAFLDGQDLWTLRHELGLHFVIPAKTGMHITADARALCRRPDAVRRTQTRAGSPKRSRHGHVRPKGQVTAAGVPELRSYDQYSDAAHTARMGHKDAVGNVLNAVVVTEWDGEVYPVGEERVFLTSLPVDQPLTALDAYDLRSLIENTAFRELKQGWYLTAYPKKTLAAVRAHVFLTLITFTLVNAFRTATGHTLAQQGIRRQRAAQHAPQVAVFTDDHYALFEIEEVLILLGVVPAVCLTTDPDRLRCRYGLDPPA
jgi:DDE family transposase